MLSHKCRRSCVRSAFHPQAFRTTNCVSNTRQQTFGYELATLLFLTNGVCHTDPGLIKWALIGLAILFAICSGISALIMYWYWFVLGGAAIYGAIWPDRAASPTCRTGCLYRQDNAHCGMGGRNHRRPKSSSPAHACRSTPSRSDRQNYNLGAGLTFTTARMPQRIDKPRERAGGGGLVGGHGFQWQ